MRIILLIAVFILGSFFGNQLFNTKSCPENLQQQCPTPTPDPLKRFIKEPVLSEHEKYVFDKINEYRISRGKEVVKLHEEVCDFAGIRAREIVFNFSHDEFEKRSAEDRMPYYGHFTENLGRVRATDNAQKVIDLWIASPIHEEILVQDTTYLCVAEYRYGVGNYWALAGWRPF